MEEIPSGATCCFCMTTYDDEALYGKFYKIEEITTHYFCLLLSSKIQQRGSDEEGILGFLVGDIRKEIERGKNMKCSFCCKGGATISCNSKKCKVRFHLPCGRIRNTFHQFFGEFKSFCFQHRIRQTVKETVVKAMSGKQSTCFICLESVPTTPSPSTLWAPCCNKDAWFHRLCIQRLALSAGYFFKCPLCNNTGKFLEAMRTHGIWIPEQDASWERDPQRYDGLLQRHNSCDAKICQCRRGRNYHLENTKWEMKLCAACGSQGMHVQCGNLSRMQDWECPVCASITLPKEQMTRTGKISQSLQSIHRRNRARRSLPSRTTQRITRQVARLSQHLEEDEYPVDDEYRETAESECSEVVKESLTLSLADATFSKISSSPTSGSSDVEILEVAENSDDEIQLVIQSYHLIGQFDRKLHRSRASSCTHSHRTASRGKVACRASWKVQEKLETKNKIERSPIRTRSQSSRSQTREMILQQVGFPQKQLLKNCTDERDKKNNRRLNLADRNSRVDKLCKTSTHRPKKRKVSPGEQLCKKRSHCSTNFTQKRTTDFEGNISQDDLFIKSTLESQKAHIQSHLSCARICCKNKDIFVKSKDTSSSQSSELSCINVGSGVELAKLPGFQPLVCLGHQISYESKFEVRRQNY